MLVDVTVLPLRGGTGVSATKIAEVIKMIDASASLSTPPPRGPAIEGEMGRTVMPRMSPASVTTWSAACRPANVVTVIKI